MNEELSPSIVEYFGSDSGHRCGYCKNSKSNLSHGMWAHEMTVSDYENLINRGWRRSGQYCYKPIMNQTCCPQYTIRCDATSFQLNHSHKKVLRKVRKFLHEKPKEGGLVTSDEMADPRNHCGEEPTHSNKQSKKAQDCGVSKNLEDHLSEETVKSNKKMNIKLVSTSSPEFQNTLQESHNLYVKYQVKIHDDKPEECSVDQYRRFLVKSPLQAEYQNCPIPTGYGSFHQQYWLDGTLIAVGVIDILPSCLSSVYFYYDPDYSFLSLGTYGALREIEFVRQLTKSDSNFRWYYMGFYIHTCPKMKYKGQFNPSFLLCPEAFTWHPIKPCLNKLDAHKYSRLNEDEALKDENPDFSEISILYKRRITTASSYAKTRSKSVNDTEEIMEYARLVGKQSAKKLLLYRS